MLNWLRVIECREQIQRAADSIKGCILATSFYMGSPVGGSPSTQQCGEETTIDIFALVFRTRPRRA